MNARMIISSQPFHSGLTAGAHRAMRRYDRPGTSNGPTEAICECRTGWSGTGWSGWSWSCRSVRDSRSNWPASAVSFG